MTGFKNAEISRWEALWQNWRSRAFSTGEFRNQRRFKYLCERLLPSRSSLTTLECGCGSAGFSAFLSMENETVVTDFSRQALKVAKKNLESKDAPCHFVLSDVERLPFKTETFDLLMSFGLFEHFKQPEIHTKEMVRVLKTGGLFFIDILTKRLNVQALISNPISTAIYRIFTGERANAAFEIWMSASQVETFFRGRFPLRDLKVVGHKPFPSLVDQLDRFYLRLLLKMQWFHDIFVGSKLALYFGCALFVHGIKDVPENLREVLAESDIRIVSRLQ